MKVELAYPELSYKLVGLAFKVFNDLGYGRPEKFYQRAYGKLLEIEKISFKKEQLIPLIYQNSLIGKYFLDFVVDEKVVIELKTRPNIGYTHIKQVVGYLKSGGYGLAILIYFTRDGVKYRRIVNLN